MQHAVEVEKEDHGVTSIPSERINARSPSDTAGQSIRGSADS